MGLLISGQVVGVESMKGGAWRRVLIGSGQRVNDVVIGPSDKFHAPEVGDTVSYPVRAAVETTADGRPTKFLVYWLEGHGETESA